MPFKYTTLLSDPFTRADNADIGSNYTSQLGTLELVGNRIRPPILDQISLERVTGVTIGENHWAEITVVDGTGISNADSGKGVGVAVNAHATSGDCFLGLMTGSTVKIRYFILGLSGTGNIAEVAFTPQAGDRIRLETRRIGDTVELTLYTRRGGVLTKQIGPIIANAFNDTGFPVNVVGGVPGPYADLNAADTLNDGLMDDFECGEIVHSYGSFGGGIVPSWGEEPWGSEPVAAAGGNVTMPADAGSYSISGSTANFKISMPADPGSYSITGGTVTPRVSMPAQGGSYQITGSDAGLRKTGKIVPDSGSYSITGGDATLRVSMPAAPGSYQITGTTANFHIVMPAAPGSYIITGSDAGLSKGRTITADSGSYSISGQDATLRATRKISAESGSYSITGSVAGLNKGRLLAALEGLYSITGTDAGTRAARKVTAVSGSYSITGGDATLRVSVPITGGVYQISGGAVNFKTSMPAGSGSYSIIGGTAGLFRGKRIIAVGGSYVIVGTDATFTIAGNKRITVDSGSYVISGQAADLRAPVRGGSARPAMDMMDEETALLIFGDVI